MEQLEKMIPLYINNKFVGNIREDGTYITFRLPNHFFIKYNGFGISYSILERLRKDKIEKIIILYHTPEQIKKYTTTLSTWLNNSVIYKDGEQDYQRILPITFFNC